MALRMDMHGSRLAETRSLLKCLRAIFTIVLTINLGYFCLDFSECHDCLLLTMILDLIQQTMCMWRKHTRRLYLHRITSLVIA